jgi:mono/diheme cytochrome c family protein
VETLQTGKDQKLSPTDGGAPVALIVMPWEDFRWMSLTDLQNIYAYLQIVPPDTNADVFGPPGGPPIPVQTTFTDGATTPAPTLPAEASDAPLFAARGRAIQALKEPAAVASLSAADLASYGRGAYLVTGQAICGDCHTNPERLSQTSTALNTAQWLTGGRVFAPGSPGDSILHVERSMSANLLGKTNGFVFSSKVTETVFATTISQHVHGDLPGTPPLAWPMPAGLQKLVADDIHALWVYLSNQTPITGAADKATQDAALFCNGSNACATGSTCNTATSECIPSAACTTDADCFACQTCATNCTAPAAASDGGPNACIANGL